MITCLIGTRAQLIKMAPVLLEIERRNLPLNLVFSGQHHETMDQLIDDFGIATIPHYLYRGKEITGIVQMTVWFLRCLFRSLRFPSQLMPTQKSERDVILVHGDTFSTLLGAVAGRLRGVDVAHIEAGLRSHNIFHPFPEELTRLAVFRLSRLSFCPGGWACGNMIGYSSKVINTDHNTLLDALRLMLTFPRHIAATFDQEYGIASIHRFENIFNRARLEHIVALIEQAAAHYPMAFVMHPATRKKLAYFGLLAKLEQNPRIKLLPRMGYADFVQLMLGAQFVITDGGGNQEELSYLGIPTLLMRKATERQEGMDTTATLCNYDESVLVEFLSKIQQPKCHQSPPLPKQSPSSVIADALMVYGEST